MPVLPPGASTVLAMTGIGIPAYSARGLHQTLQPIDAAVMTRRTVNGALLNLAPPQFAKYKSTITGADQDPPGLDGIFPGLAVTVDCIAELSISGAAQRPEVPGSIRVNDNDTFYRPRLEMMVTGFSIDTDEWGAQVGWTLDLEEAPGSFPGSVVVQPPALLPPPPALTVTTSLTVTAVPFASPAPLGTTVATVSAVNSDGSVFAGMVFFAAPLFDAGGVFALQGHSVVINPLGPGIGSLSGPVTNLFTLGATP
jgi:hypothetical protein